MSREGGLNGWNRGIAAANRVEKSLLNTRLTHVSKPMGGLNGWNRGIAEANRVKKSLLNTRLTPVSKLPPPATPRAVELYISKIENSIRRFP